MVTAKPLFTERKKKKVDTVNKYRQCLLAAVGGKRSSHSVDCAPSDEGYWGQLKGVIKKKKMTPT